MNRPSPEWADRLPGHPPGRARDARRPGWRGGVWQQV